METTALAENKYQKYEKLYISKETGKPEKMEIKDTNQNTIIYIIYNEININTYNANLTHTNIRSEVYADLSPVVGSEQGGIRPVLIIQNDLGNKYSPTVIAAAITSQMNKTKLPTHIEINSENCGLKNDSVVLAEQIRTIDKSRLKEKIGHIEDENIINKINNALGVSFGLGE